VFLNNYLHRDFTGEVKVAEQAKQNI